MEILFLISLQNEVFLSLVAPFCYSLLQDSHLLSVLLFHFHGVGSVLFTIFIFIEFKDKVFESSTFETKIYMSTHKFVVKGSPWEEAADVCFLNLGDKTRIYYKIHTWLTKIRLENRTDCHKEVRKSDSWSRWRCR